MPSMGGMDMGQMMSMISSIQSLTGGRRGKGRRR
jgi:hypothetical protein